MEQPRFPRRSASHGTLRSSYSSQGSPFSHHPLHKPLRSVKENSVLLHSPGALESMLKTTTETGDIGIFSIGAVPPSPLARGASLDNVRPRPRPQRSVDNMYRQPGAVRPQYNREITSEVLSVYGSDSLKSGASTLSPNSFDDLGQRSYSMTTCGSRHLSHHRSTNTLQSQASSASHLQRPRSPFPYPTRLKRPGVRPASPAVTENGVIDYSRMVEIDRVSYRTVHGHFQYTYSPMPRRPPYPLGLRPDANRSTSSLAPPGPPPRFHGPPCPPPLRTHSPMSMASWKPPLSDRVDSASVRTSSLTSAVNGCRQVSSTFVIGGSRPVEPPPRYYDYTEDFENRPSRPNHIGGDFNPVPTQIAPYAGSEASQEDDDTLGTRHLAAVFGENDSAFVDGESHAVDQSDVAPALFVPAGQSEGHAETTSRSPACSRRNSARSRRSTIGIENTDTGYKPTRSSDIDLLPSQSGRDSIDTFNPSLDIESRSVAPPYKFLSYHASTAPRTETKSLERHVQVLGGRTPTIRSEQGVILQDDLPGVVGSCEAAEDLTSRTEVAEGVSFSRSGTPKAPVNVVIAPTLQAGIERTSVGVGEDVQCGQTPPSRIRSPQWPESTRDGSISPEEEPGETDDQAADSSGLSPRNSQEKDQGQFRRHRRNPAALRISTTNLPRDDNEGHPHITPTCSTAPLISPKPISPARQLKVKNSIPQLMKALPPLPGDLGYNLPPAATDVSDGEDFAEILVPFNFNRPLESTQIDQHQAPKPIAAGRDEIGRGLQGETPKFRLKIKSSNCSESSEALQRRHQSRGNSSQSQSEGNMEADNGCEAGGKNMRRQNRNKLKIRSPRRSTMSSPRPSTVRRNRSVEASHIVTDLVRKGTQDLFSASPKPEAMVLRKRRSPLSSSVTTELPLSETTISVRQRVPSTVSSGDSDALPIDGATLMSAMPRRGLIKRLSNIRALLSSTSPTSMRARESYKSSNFTADGSIVNLGTTNRVTDAGQLRLGQRLRARLSRWVKGAEAVMRKRAKRKHNSNDDGSRESDQT
ncbi:hypothetical protein F5Y17DRAFT_286853 [Xylariaceae sp. FL0594]|nr:hypothetical protein F5Y17DRAFT_286853 [Xylariaceae sp. FL0594]